MKPAAQQPHAADAALCAFLTGVCGKGRFCLSVGFRPTAALRG
jgi:hypothetical protein